jgi:ribosome-associated protein
MNKRPPKPRSKAPAASALPASLRVVQSALEDLKAVNVRMLDVRGLTDVTDFMVIASGNSDRHVRSIAERVLQAAKASGVRPFGVEGERDGEWVLVDLPDAMVHVMLPRVREFYGLEELWDRGHNVVEAPAAARAPRSPAPRPSAPRRRRPAAARE